jgi:hypothetical protein
MEISKTIKNGLFATILISTPFLPSITEKIDTAYLMYYIEFTDSLTKGYFRANPESTIPIAYSDIKKAEKELTQKINNEFYNRKEELKEEDNLVIDILDDEYSYRSAIGVKIPKKSYKEYAYLMNTNNLKTKDILQNATVNNILKKLRNRYNLTQKPDTLTSILRHYNKPEEITKFISVSTIHNLTTPFNQSKTSLNIFKNFHESEIISGYEKDKTGQIYSYVRKNLFLNLNWLLPLKADPTVSSDTIENIMVQEPAFFDNIMNLSRSLSDNPCLSLYFISKTELPLFSAFMPLQNPYKENIYPVVYAAPGTHIFESKQNLRKKETLNFIKNTIESEYNENPTSKKISVFYNTEYKKLWENCDNYEIKKMAIPYSKNLDEYDTTYIKLIQK